MDRLRVLGGRKLSGKLRVSGAKNAALPAMAAALLTDQALLLENVPDVWDVATMRRLLSELGTEVSRPSANELELTTRTLRSHVATYDLVKTMRASVLVLGPLVARDGRARVSLPGGCAIGARPIDQHLKALEKLGARVDIEHGFVNVETDGLVGADIGFDTVTVTGTENLMLAACLARGRTVLSNCAREPEIVDLAQLLRGMGARIEGEGTPRIVIEGVERLKGGSHTVIPDRIETGTYLIAGALAGDDVELTHCRSEHIGALASALRKAKVPLEIEESRILVRRSARRLHGIDITTEPYPGFPTDMQAQLMVFLTQADGESSVVETIFENRFMHVAELSRMGARIELDGHRAKIHGPSRLSGAKVMATDLRASACLVLAALIAEGETSIERVYHLDRGYERLEEKLGGLGAGIERISG
jgi:UDP-N-acetylglucosamine 1-carboxyvinyltransferase